MGFHLSISFGSNKKESPVTAPVVDSPVSPVAESSVDAPQQVKVITDRSFDEDDFLKKIGPIIREEFLKFDRSLGSDSALPVVGAGRVSQYEGFRNFLPGINQPVPTNFDFKTLRILAHLAINNRHISQAVDNIRTMGNTDFKIKFDKSVGAAQASTMLEYLEETSENWYEFSDGDHALDNDLFTQLAVYGAISAESVITPDLRRIGSVVRVDPYFIRFAYDPQTAKHIPLQQLIGFLGTEEKGKFPGYIELNPNTYSYMAMVRMGEMPYAMPPFAAALEDIATQNDMIGNFKNMMRRIGMLGFLSVLVNAPKQVDGETPIQYSGRCANYLETLRPAIEQGFSRGIAIGFKDTHQFEIGGSELNSVNAENLMKMVNCLIFSGVKQDPNMNGYNYSTTETFGRVIMEKMTGQVMNYQNSVAAYRAKLYKLALLLAGFKVKKVTVEYDVPSTKDKAAAAKAKAAEIDNARALYDDGIIDQPTRAQMLGYDKPAELEPRKSPEQKLAEKTAVAKTSNALKRLNALKKN